MNKKSSVEKETSIEELKVQWYRDQIERAKQIDIKNNPAILSSDVDGVLINSQMWLVGGLDISYSTWDHSLACGCLVVYNIQTKTVVYQQLIEETVTIPYIPGFLGYREFPVFQKLFHNLRQDHPEFFPHILLVDGQGTYHPRHFGSACAIGLELDIPTIGVAKNPFCGPIFERDEVDHQTIQNDDEVDVCWNLSEFQTRLHDGTKVMHYGECIGKMICKEGTTKPIYVSAGHKLSLNQAVSIVKELCFYRVPEPIRLADHLSREYLAQLKSKL